MYVMLWNLLLRPRADGHEQPRNAVWDLLGAGVETFAALGGGERWLMQERGSFQETEPGNSVTNVPGWSIARLAGARHQTSSGPGREVQGLHARDTRRVYEKLLGSATRSAWVATYAFFDGPRAFEVLARRMDETPTLKVTLLTGAALDHNIEVGLLVRDRVLAATMTTHFRTLIGRSLLTPCPREQTRSGGGLAIGAPVPRRARTATARAKRTSEGPARRRPPVRSLTGWRPPVHQAGYCRCLQPLTRLNAHTASTAATLAFSADATASTMPSR